MPEMLNKVWPYIYAPDMTSETASTCKSEMDYPVSKDLQWRVGKAKS